MASIVSVNTYTHNVTYVTDKMLNSLKYIISLVGLDPTKFVSDWKTYDLGVQTWLQSRHLESIILEVADSSGSLVTRCDFTIDYSYGSGDGTMWVDTDALKHAITKFGTIPSQCNYNIIVTTSPGRPHVPGWQSVNFLSTEGFIKQGLGTTIGTQTIGAQASYWRKSL
jgi:hypothetical protein